MILSIFTPNKNNTNKYIDQVLQNSDPVRLLICKITKTLLIYN
jgi:hypothetical protein